MPELLHTRYLFQRGDTGFFQAIPEVISNPNVGVCMSQNGLSLPDEIDQIVLPREYDNRSHSFLFPSLLYVEKRLPLRPQIFKFIIFALFR
jgi:hypothetical protein